MNPQSFFVQFGKNCDRADCRGERGPQSYLQARADSLFIFFCIGVSYIVKK